MLFTFHVSEVLNVSDSVGTLCLFQFLGKKSVLFHILEHLNLAPVLKCSKICSHRPNSN